MLIPAHMGQPGKEWIISLHLSVLMVFQHRKNRPSLAISRTIRAGGTIKIASTGVAIEDDLRRVSDASRGNLNSILIMLILFCYRL